MHKLGASGLGLGAFGAHALTKYVGDNPTKVKVEYSGLYINFCT